MTLEQVFVVPFIAFAFDLFGIEISHILKLDDDIENVSSE